jgi:hypothetical protein
MVPRGFLRDRRLRPLVILAALLFVFVLATCGGGGGDGGATKVTITGLVDDGGGNTSLPTCRFVDKRTGTKLSEDRCEQDGSFQLLVDPGREGYVYCGPESMSNLNLTTYSSTVGYAAGQTKSEENVTPTTTVVADIIRYEKPPDPEARKAQLIIQAQSDPDLRLVINIAGRLYRAMLAENINASFGNDRGDGGDPGGSDSDCGVGGDAGDGADFSPLSNAECSFMVGSDFGNADSIPLAALADLLDDGELDRPDLKDLTDEVFEGITESPEAIQQAFATWFGENGLGEALTTRTNDEGEYFLRIPPKVAGYLRCVPNNSQNLVVGTYIPGREVGEILNDEAVNPATTVFSVIVASKLDEELETVKDNYLSDIEGLKVLLDWPDYPEGTLDGFTAQTGPDTNSEVGLVAFSATALFNIFYKNGLDVDFPEALADLVDNVSEDPENPVDPAFMEAQGIPAARAQELAGKVNDSIGKAEVDLDTDLATALSTARVHVTVMNAEGLVADAEVTIIFNGETYREVTGDSGDNEGQVTLTLSGVPQEATEIVVTVSAVPGYDMVSKTIEVVAFATVDLDFNLEMDIPQPFVLGIQGSGDGRGSVSSTPSGISCGVNGGAGEACAAPFASGTQVTLSATPEAGSAFDGWSGACSGGGPTCTLTVDADTNVTARFSIDQCTESDLEIAPEQASFGADGGEGSFTVTATGNCTWSASSNRAWIQIVDADNSGSGAVSYRVLPNNDGAERTGSITLAGHTHRVIQGACEISISPPSRSFTYTGGTGSIGVTAASNCAWSASTNVTWIIIASGSDSGTGNGTITYTIQPNTDSPQRTGTISVSGETHTVTQGPGPCTYTITPASRNFDEEGGTGTITVTPSYEGCTTPWTATVNVGWITITSGDSGSGGGTVNYRVAANTGEAQRSGTITVAGQAHRVTQEAPCRYSIEPDSRNFSSEGGDGTIGVAAGDGCAWSASSNRTWIRITSGASGSGDGTVRYTVDPYTGTTIRSGTITVAGETHTVTQAPGPCTYTITPASRDFDEEGGTGTITVTPSYEGCTTPWNASSNRSWIRITSGASGSGDGTVRYTVDPYTGTTIRNGTITVAGQTHTVTQNPPCRYSIEPDSRIFSSEGGDGTIDVSAGDGCEWNASSNRTWIRITSGTSGSGDGRVRYSVDSYTGTTIRNGTITVAGQTHTVTQNPPCRYSIEPDSENFSSEGGDGTIDVSAGDGCEWNASSNRTWIRITSGTSGSGDGRVRYSVDSYTGTTIRNGTITVAGQTHTVTQDPPAPRHEITHIDMTPSSPAFLEFNERVNITFDYHTDEAGGVLIFARPYTNGSITPHYAAHPSPLYPAGDGDGDGYFTITSGRVTVDQVRVRMTNADQSQTLFETYINVSYTYDSIDVTGTWDLDFDWGCDGSSASGEWYISSGGSFTDSYGLYGTWSLNGSQFSLRYSTGAHAVYTGTVSGDQMEGEMVDDDEDTGCWSATRGGELLLFKDSINSGESSVGPDGTPPSP